MNMQAEFNPFQEAEEPSLGMDDYLAMLKRRRSPMLKVASIVFFIALIAALFWPPTFRSSATILIEEQEIPEDMVRSTISTFAQQQIQIIEQRVMTLKNIMSMVEKYELYDEGELRRTPRSEIAKEVGDALRIDLLSAEVVDPRSGRPVEAVIAFTIDFDWDSPKKSLGVANELVNLFLNENLKTRTQKAASTTEFLAKEAEDLNNELRALESSIAAFKVRNSGSMPENFQVNLQRLGALQTQQLSMATRLQQIEQRLIELKASLVQTNPYAPTILATGEPVLADVDRLKALRSEYRKKASVYSQDHPDLKRLSREIDALSAAVGHAGDKGELEKLLSDRAAQLSQLRAKYTPDHPEVVAYERLVQQLQQQLELADDGASVIKPDNPAYVMLDSQIRAMEIEKQSLQTELASISGRMEELGESAAKGPGVEREYTEMVRNLEVTRAKYLDLKVKLREAELSGELEQGRKGQRFTMIEPPRLPEEPVKPNRMALIFLGLVLAAGAGLGVVVVLEAADQSMRGSRGVTATLGVPPLVVIPYIQTPAELEANRPDKKLFYMLGAGVVLFITMLVLINFFYKPLDVLWYMVLRKLGIG